MQPFLLFFFMNEYFVKVDSQNIDDFRKTRCICVYAHGFWEIALFSITSDNEGAEGCNCLLTTLGSDEGTFCTSSI